MLRSSGVHAHAFALTIVLLFSAVQSASAQISSRALDFAQAFRRVEPFLVQDIVVSSADSEGRRVFLLAEPPESAFRSREKWLSEVFGTSYAGYEVVRHGIGFDGYSSDLVVETGAQTEAQIGAIAAAIHSRYWGTDYKASYRLYDPMPWDAMRSPRRRVGPPNLEISAASLNGWLIEAPEVQFSAVQPDIAAPMPLSALLDAGSTGVFYGEPAGLVVLILPQNEPLNDLSADIRRFFVDTDVLVGAVTRQGAPLLALVGRERTTSLHQAEPLRVDTFLTLAATREENLAQSYERRLPLAGKTTDPKLIRQLNSAGDLDWFNARFGSDAEAHSTDPATAMWDERRALSVAVDWAPILLSRELTHTEYGQLLNMTDQMLKGWTSANFVHYANFPYPTPYGNPDASGLYDRLKWQLSQPFNELTFNWNTSGFGSWSDFGEFRIFTLFRTGSLPVSYFPDDGSFTPDDETEAILKKTEDDYWSFFANQRDPYLTRAAEYAALHVIFTSVRMESRRTEALVPEQAYSARWDSYASVVATALGGMQSALTAATHPLGQARPISEDGYGFVIDPNGNCITATQDHEDWVVGGGAEAARAALAAEPNLTAAAQLLVNPGRASERMTDANGRTGADLLAWQAKIDHQIDAYNQDVDACQSKPANASGCTDSDLLPRRLALEGELNELHASMDAYAASSDAFWTKVDDLNGVIPYLPPFGSCSLAWHGVAEGVPDAGEAVQRTPSIVVSAYQHKILLRGGHNLDGRAVEVLADKTVAAGKVEIDAQAGIIRLNPAEMPKAQSVVRAFERDFKRYVNGDLPFQARVQARVQAALAEDLRAVQAYDDLALGRVGFNSQGDRGLAIRTSTTADGETRVLVQPAVQQADVRSVAELADHAARNEAQIVVRTLDDGAVELSFPSGRPPVVVRAGSRDGLQSGFEDIVEYAIRSGDADAGTIAIVDYGGRTTLGDMLALKYSAEARTLPRSAAGRGGGAGEPPGGIRGFLFDADPPRRPGNSGSGTPPGDGGGVGKTSEGGPRLMVGFFGRRGAPLKVLKRTDADWVAAEIDPVSLQVVGDRGLFSIKMLIPFKKAETPTLTARLKSIFSRRAPTADDSNILSRAIRQEFARDDVEPLWKRLEHIRAEYLSAYPKGEGPMVIWELTDSAQDFLVVENDQVWPDIRPAAHDQG